MTVKFKTLDDLDAKGKRVLVRVDLNVPMSDGKITDVTRIERSAPTIAELSRKGAKVILLSHFGRPKGQIVTDMSLGSVANAVSDVIGLSVSFAKDCVGDEASATIGSMQDGEIVLLENTRFHPGEEQNDLTFAKELAIMGDAFVADAFSAAHRAHGSTEGVAHLLPSYAGRAMEAELKALEAALTAPKRPVVAVVGGAKISSKLDLLNNLVEKVDSLVIGGGMANTFLAAKGVSVGASLCEHDLADTARAIMAKAEKANCTIILPRDVVVAQEFKAGASSRTVPVADVGEKDMILDVGSESIADIAVAFEAAKTVVWNGPLGAFEIDPFDNGTNLAARHAAMLSKNGRLISVAGGGDTVAALNKARVTSDFSYVSTAGGAFLEWLEGKVLPGVKILYAE
jgi:phosphoglycerate kinase